MKADLEQAEVRDKTREFAEAIAIAATLYNDTELAVWLTAPQPLHNGWTPLQMLGCSRSDELLRSLQAMDAGVYL